MPSPQDPSNPLRSVLTSLKNSMGSGKEVKRKWKEETGELTAEDYPALSLLVPKPKAAAPEVQERESHDARLKRIVQEGELRKLEGGPIGRVFLEVLAGGFQDTFVEAIEQLHKALESSAPDDRRWGLESVRALTALEDLSLVPYGTLPLLLDCVGRMLVREERVELRNSALEISASLLGIEAVQGDLESVHAHLAWLERTARARGTEYTACILASRQLVIPILGLLFQEGHSVLEGKVLPFFRFVGEPAGRTLMALLDEEQNRQHRNRILELLKLLGALSVPALKEGLVGGSWQQVRNALNLVGDLEETQAFEYVVPCLEHADPRVVHAAIRALWKTGGARAERYLLDLLPAAKAETQSEILHGLGQAGSAEAVPALGRLAAEGADILRIQALDTLGRLKRPEAIPLLEGLAKRKGRIFKTAEPLPIRLAAARALVSIGTLDARRILDRILEEEPKGSDHEALRKTTLGLNAWG